MGLECSTAGTLYQADTGFPALDNKVLDVVSNTAVDLPDLEIYIFSPVKPFKWLGLMYKGLVYKDHWPNAV